LGLRKRREDNVGKEEDIMKKVRRVLVAGLGAITPAFITADQIQARAAEDGASAPAQSGAPTVALDQEALKSALLGLSPAEKLRIAGDRIRLAKTKVQATSRSRVVKTTMVSCIPSLCDNKRSRPQAR
jgi:hypothetical protein